MSLIIDGEWISDQNKLMEVARDHFKNLFSKDAMLSNSSNIQSSFSSPFTFDQDRAVLDRSIQDNEILFALKKMKPLKAPGSDGI